MMKPVYTLLVLLISYCTSGQELVVQETQVSLDTIVQTLYGEIVYSPMGGGNGPIASGRSPREYKMFLYGDVKGALVETLQSLNYSVDFTDDLDLMFTCSAEQYPESKDYEVGIFQTDFVDLSSKYLKLLNSSREELSLSTNSKIVYQTQIQGCFELVQHFPIANDQSDWNMIYNRVVSGGLFGEGLRPDLNVKLIVSLIIEKRALKGSFYPEKSNYESKIVLDKVINMLYDQFNELTPSLNRGIDGSYKL